MSSIYFWSDMHLGDQSVADLRGYDSLADHDEAVLEAWSSTIRERDIVYFLGDLSIHDVPRSLDKVSKLAGRKRIVWGNHDPAHPMFTRSHRWHPRFMEVFETGDSVGFLKIDKVPTMLSHFPYFGDHSEWDRHEQYRLRHNPGPLIHGHVHHLWETNRNQFNVGVDVRNKPVSIDEVRAWISSRGPSYG